MLKPTAPRAAAADNCSRGTSSWVIACQAGTFKAVSLRFVLGYDKSNFGLVLDLLNAGRIDPRPMITDEIGLGDLPQAFEALRKPQHQVKVLIRPGD